MLLNHESAGPAPRDPPPDVPAQLGDGPRRAPRSPSPSRYQSTRDLHGRKIRSRIESAPEKGGVEMRVVKRSIVAATLALVVFRVGVPLQAFVAALQAFVLASQGRAVAFAPPPLPAPPSLLRAWLLFLTAISSTLVGHTRVIMPYCENCTSTTLQLDYSLTTRTR